MQNSLCNFFKDEAEKISKNIMLAHSNNIIWDEETITNNLILKLCKQNNPKIKVLQFNKKEESTNGSDWEFFIVGKIFTFKMRIQAKKKYIEKNDISTLNHSIGKAKHSQMDLLISEAEKLFMMPTYCFYSAENSRKFWSLSNNSSLQKETGCLISSAKTIKRLNTNIFVKIEKECFPWHYIVCQNSSLNHDYPNIDILNGNRELNAKSSYINYLHRTGRADINPYIRQEKDIPTIMNYMTTFDTSDQLPKERVYYFKNLNKDDFNIYDFARRHGIMGRIYFDVR